MAAKTNFELKMGVATREAFGKALVELARENNDIVVCDADLSKSTMVHWFAKEFPDRFFSCGIAEANLVAIGSGLGASGKVPFVASFAAFAMNKGFEQLRVTAAYPPDVNLKVVGTHAGISIGEDGPSQMSIEDLSLATALPGFTVISPADEVAMAAFIRLAASTYGPFFVRAGRVKVPIVYSPDQKFEIGKAIELLPGSDVTLIAHGLMVAESIRAAEILEKQGISAAVLDIPTIKPLDNAAVARAATLTRAIVVSEEHLVDGGLGVKVAQAVALSSPCVMEFVGLTDYAESGSPEQLLEKYGMTAGNVAAAARRALARKK
ncbi:MAG TPA: transketolase C-terminal domain-containing protein [Bryobacteraceae bacterium]|nr:transketolase C-terminal domain-containing protein [Bryobacteraceae bacterium]